MQRSQGDSWRRSDCLDTKKKKTFVRRKVRSNRELEVEFSQKLEMEVQRSLEQFDVLEKVGRF